MSTFATNAPTNAPTNSYVDPDPPPMRGFGVVVDGYAGIPGHAHQQQAQLQAQQQQAQQYHAQQRQRQLSYQQEQCTITNITYQNCNLGNWNCPKHPAASLAPSGDQWTCTSCGECGGRRFGE